MPQISKVGDGHGGSEDYATLALWAAAEISVNYGGTKKALLKGFCGTRQTISGSSPDDIEIYTDGIQYEGNNDTQLAWFNGLTVNTTSNVLI